MHIHPRVYFCMVNMFEITSLMISAVHIPENMPYTLLVLRGRHLLPHHKRGFNWLSFAATMVCSQLFFSWHTEVLKKELCSQTLPKIA